MAETCESCKWWESVRQWDHTRRGDVVQICVEPMSPKHGQITSSDFNCIHYQGVGR